VVNDDINASKIFDIAVDTRKFEIEHFWKRSVFFWGFIASAFVAYGSLYKGDKMLALTVACFGFVCSVAWTLVNRGSKYWQENWEQKVGQQEHAVLGTYFFLKREKRLKKGLWLGARRFSVSKITIALSDFTTAIWLLLMVWTVFGSTADFGQYAKVVLFSLSLLFAVLMGYYGRISPPPEEPPGTKEA
jgi:hypothetical protein